jgi:hypothetical protein
MRHGIRQAVFELSLRDQSVAALDAYRQFFERQVQPALAKSLDELAAPDQDQHIERLEIDLGTIDFDSARSDWRGKITKVLSHVLSQSVVTTEQRVMGEEIEGQGTSAGQARLVDLILYFLRRGLLPWYESRPFVQLEREFQSGREFASGTLSPVQLSAIEQILGNSRSRVRLLRALLPATRAWILRTFIEARLKEFANIDSPLLDAKAQAETLQQWIFRSGLPERDLQKIASAEWWAKSRQRISALQDAAPTEVSLRLQHGLQEIAISDHAAESTLEARRNETEIHKAEPADQAIYVENAGVVLVAVFLPRLFSRLGLLDADERFSDHAAAEYAVHLVHYLASGETDPHESELVLAKVLCGLDVEHALAHEVRLSGQASDECDDLLVAAIRHWKTVGNTSIVALRETFLQREGKLERLQSGWHLTVEQKGVDVLVSSLPWALGTIRLPWLATPLRVDWA